MRFFRFCLGVACCVVALVPGFSLAQGAGEAIWIPMHESGIFGRRDIQLEATLYKPAGAGPYPTVVFSHGSSGGPIPAHYTEKAAGLAAYLSGKGIALLVPMRRGRGQSQGRNAEEPSACTPEAARDGLDYATAALDATFDYLRKQPWAALDKVVLAGHSRGGILSLIYAAEHPGVAIGTINFSGGWKNDNCGPVDINLALFSAAAGGGKVPSLFLYAQGDGFYSDASIQKYAQVFTQAGGDVDFRFFHIEKVNGHLLFHRVRPVWDGAVGAFLQRIGAVPLASE